jgi:hypothetical protein
MPSFRLDQQSPTSYSASRLGDMIRTSWRFIARIPFERHVWKLIEVKRPYDWEGYKSSIEEEL